MAKNSLSRFRTRFVQFGGGKLIMEYVRMGLFFEGVQQLMNVFMNRKTLNKAYSDMRKHIAEKLTVEFWSVMKDLEGRYENNECMPHNRSNKVWFCWLQGMDNAPDVVKMCLSSLHKNLIDKEIIVLSEGQLQNYVSLPDYIQKKYEKGIIPFAHYSDIIRLELLIKYGGSWIDSTVLCLGPNYPQGILDCDLFVFQKDRREDEQFSGLSNWFITSCSNNKILMILRDMLYEYWKRYDCVIDYFIFHNFFMMIAKQFDHIISGMPFYSNIHPLKIVEHLADKYDETVIQEIYRKCGFVKLTYRITDETAAQDTYYSKLMELYKVADIKG